MKHLKKLFLLCLFLLATLTPVFANSLEELFQQGSQLYTQKKYQEAVVIWQQAATMGNPVHQAASLGNLSLTYQNLGKWTEAETAINKSLQLLATQETNPTQQEVLAKSLDIQGQLQQAIGKPQPALLTWQQAAKIYTNLKQLEPLKENHINQAQAMIDMGLYPRACQTLLEVLEIPSSGECQLHDTQWQKKDNIRAWRSLGSVLAVIGDPLKAEKALQQSIAQAQQEKKPEEESKGWLNLGNLQKALSQQPQSATTITTAINSYQQAVKLGTPLIKAQALINQLDILIDSPQLSQANELLPPIEEILPGLPSNHTTNYLKINYAISLHKLNHTSKAIHLLTNTAQIAQDIGDISAQSYAYGTLAQWTNKPEYNQEALKLARSISARELSYRWEWQEGKWFKQQGDIPQAKLFYRQALQTLQSLRSDLVSINPELQFSFRQSVEPVYREYVDLLLTPTNPSQEILQEARDTIDALQLAELENFFRTTCLDAKPVVVDEITQKNDPTAAFVYTILLPNRWEIILKLPQQQELKHYTTPIDNLSKVLNTVERLRVTAAISNSREILGRSQQVYQWLMAPIAKDLQQNGVETLVFVLDNPLRNIPMGVLHDGQKYLIETYNIVLVPSAQLIDPQPLKRAALTTLAGGLTEAREDFPPLKYVQEELQQIQSRVNGVLLLDKQFTNQNLAKEITTESFPIVHLATHGQFSSQLENTFLLTWNGRININQLKDLLRSPIPQKNNTIELLILSACETLTGDDRAALGLAGVAIKSGARSTVATLWRVNDQSSAVLMNKFYQALQQPGINKAQALRQAQLALLQSKEYSSTSFWAPYVILGNWL